MLDEQFTVQTMEAALRQNYNVVHIASHFQLQPGNDTDSFLLLGDGSRLALSQIDTSQNLFGGVELLTLSACDTAVGGTIATGKEVEGFGVMAQQQGAKAVIATLWQVADESTSRLMREFYSLRVAQPGKPKAEALRQAQLSFLNSNEKGSGVISKNRGIQSERENADKKANYTHPYYWAPFILIGNWR